MPDYPDAITRDNWQKHGERPSLLDFGAKGDLQYFTASVVSGSALVHSTFSACSGTITSAGGVITGTGTKFLSEVQTGQYISASGQYVKVLSILDDTHLLASSFSPNVTAVAYAVGVGFSSATDVGKRMVIYGGGSGADRESLIAESPAVLSTVDAYTPTASMDAQSATAVKVAVNCEQNDVTWELFGANLADYSDEVVISGPTNVTALAASSIYTGVPTKRYYRTKIKNKTAGLNAVAYVTNIALGRMTGANIVSVQSAVQCTISKTCSSDRSSAAAYFGTDDTVAIQNAFDVGTSLVPPGTADGGITIEAPRGRYLFSSPIFHTHMVSIKGHSGGASIFQADGEAFPLTTIMWNMTGTFPSDQRIAFYTRIEDLRIHCGHVAGSIGVFCDALQENSGIKRCTIIGWRQYGIQACTNSDRYGCTNCRFDDNWVYPSNATFADDTASGFVSNYALHFTIARGTYLGQAGFICGYGKGLDISNGDANLVGEIHCEASRIGVHFNAGSGGTLTFLTTQSHVQTGVVLEGGNPITCTALNTASQTALNDPLNSYTSDRQYISQYMFSPITNPTVLGTALMMPGDITAPNVITWNNLNFSQANQGGWFSVNSRSDGFPNWVKTSRNASNDAMFFRQSAQGIEVRVGPAAQPVYVAQGVCNVSGTAVTWVSGDPFNTGWAAGSQIILNGATVAVIASVASTTSLALQGSAGTLTGVSFGVSTDTSAFGGTNPGRRWMLVEKDTGVNTPFLNFDVLVNGPMNFGNSIDVNRAQWQHGQSAQHLLSLLRSTNSGATFTDDMCRWLLDIGATQLFWLFFDGVTPLNLGNNYDVNRARIEHGSSGQAILDIQRSPNSGALWGSALKIYLDDGSIVAASPIFPQAADKFQAGLYQGSGDPNGSVSAAQGSLYLDTAGKTWINTGGGSTWTAIDAGIWKAVTGGIRTNNAVGINRDPTGGFDLDVNGNAEVHGNLKNDALTATRPVQTDGSKQLISARIKLSDSNMVDPVWGIGNIPQSNGTTFVAFDFVTYSNAVEARLQTLETWRLTGETAAIDTTVTPNLTVTEGLVTNHS